MTELPNIIQSKIIDKSWDEFWKEFDLPAEISTAAKALVLTLPYEAGSADEMQLQKMLAACKLGSGDYNIVKIPAEQLIAWHQLRDKLNPKYILLLGIAPQQLGISAMFHLYAPNRFNECVWIAAPSLPDLEQQPEAKKQLWVNGLKPVFVDNEVKQ